MRPSWVSQNLMVRCVEYAMNFPCFGRAMHEKMLPSGTGHSRPADRVDASNPLILLSDMTKRRPWNQRGTVSLYGVTVTMISTRKRPLMLSQTQTELRVAIAIRSPCGEYLAALREPTLVECLHSLASCNVPDGGAIRCTGSDEPRRVWREIDSDAVVGIPVRKDFFVCLCVPYKHVSPVCPRCDPSAVLGHSETLDILRFHCCHLLAVFHPPHSNPLVVTGQGMLAIR